MILCVQMKSNKSYKKTFGEFYSKHSLLVDIIFFILPTIFIGLLKNEFLSSVVLLFLLIFYSFFIDYVSNEWILFVVGIVLSIISEIGGDLLFKLQSWSSGSFFGIPFWLPLLWAYAFIFIRRIGNGIVKFKGLS